MEPAALNKPETSRENASPLTKRELIWRDRYGMLESHGYRLRQRYKPDWKPSWLTTKRPPPLHDDFKANRSTVTSDAVRIADGRKVFLKRVPVTSSELRILRFLSGEDKLLDPNNHTVPLLDEFADDDDPSFVYMVMPLLRHYDFPEFFSVDEVIDFVKQVLEGLVYMHEQHVAHRDCSDLNIMMDAEPLYPRGYHPLNLLADSSGYKVAHPKRRRDVPSVRYYFIDFGISSMFGSDEKYPRVLGLECQDHDVPELSDSVPYNPFYVDVFLVGNLFRTAFCEKYENFGFLDFLISEMTRPNPRHRVDSAEALNIFNEVIRRQPQRILKWRLKTKSSGKLERLIQDVDSITYMGLFIAKNAISSTSENLKRFWQRHFWPAKGGQ